jgi:putative colanic acid biosynthesis UDP-glucose lipid carrier transferase
LLLDALIIIGLLPAVFWLYQHGEWTDSYSFATACGVGLFYLFADMNDIYRNWFNDTLVDAIGRVWLAWLGVIICLLMLGYATKSSAIYSRVAILAWFILTPLVLSLVRVASHQFRRRRQVSPKDRKRVCIIGAGDLAKRVADAIAENPWTGLMLEGHYVDSSSQPDETDETTVQVAGSIEDAIARAQAGSIDVVFIALPSPFQHTIQDTLVALADTTVTVHVVPDLFLQGLMHGRWMQIAELPAISIFESPFKGMNAWVKRIEDICLGLTILLLVGLPMLIIAIMIKLTSKGPVIFKQRRYGLHGEEIIIYKFRSMSVQEDGDYVAQATQADPRVTRLGRFLRRTSLDELPQFINVLQGTMSIVGPRPHAVAHNELYRKQVLAYMQRHKVKPGITGWAQVNGWRGETNTVEKMRKRVEYDLAYIRNWSFWLDLRIIFLTVVRGFVGRNVY